MESPSIIPLIFFPSIGCMGFISNAFLFLAVWKSTPSNLSTYSILIVNSAIVDMIASLACILTVPRQITTMSGFVLIFHGPGRYLGESFCCICFSLLIYSLLMSHYLLCTSFAFRLYVLVRNRLRKVGVALTLVLVNGINFLVIISMCFEFASSHSISWQNDDRIPEDIRDFTIGVLEISTRLTTKIMLVQITSTTPIAFSCCFFLHRRILMYLRNNKFGLSLATLMTHQMLMKALRCQLIISFIASLGALLLLLSIFEILRAPFLDYLQPAINSSVLIASPLVNLIFVKPYREYAMRSMGFPPSNVISPIALVRLPIYK